MAQNKARIEEFDIAKGISILCVILGHLGIYNVNRIVFTFHMPIFFLISGYFISTKNSFEEFLKKKFRGIIWPYGFTCFLICLLSIPISYYEHQDIWNNLFIWICGSFYGAGLPDVPIIFNNYSPFIGALWFLPALFWGTLITRKIIDISPYFSSTENNNISFLIFSVIFYVGWKTAETIWLPFDIQAGMTSSLFIFIGYLAKKYHVFSYKIPQEWILFLLFISIWNMKYFNGLWFVKNYFGNGLFDVIAALSTSFLIMKICQYIKLNFRIISSVFKWYGKNSIIVLAFHIIELDLFPWNILIAQLDDFFSAHFITILLVILIKIIWVSLGIVIINNCRYLKYFYAGGRV